MSREATSKTVFYNTNQDNNTVETPDDLYAALDEIFHFTHDPCPAGGLEDENVPDGLTSEWGVSNYVNPPYNCTELWITKAVTELETRSCESVFLIPVHINTRYWREKVFKYASEVWFIGDRVAFKGYRRKIPTPLCVVVYSLDRRWQAYKKQLGQRLEQIRQRRKHLDQVFKVINPAYRASDKKYFYSRALEALGTVNRNTRTRFSVLQSKGYTFYRFPMH